jgi:hypothetical protein
MLRVHAENEAVRILNEGIWKLCANILKLLLEFCERFRLVVKSYYKLC